MSKIKIEFSGIIETSYDNDGNWNVIKLVQPDGYKIDLVLRAKEAKANYLDHSVQVNYWLSDKPCDKNKMLEEHLKKISGSLQAEYEKSDYQYSSWTKGTDYDTILQVGGHNLYSELRAEAGRFLIIEFNFKP